MDLLIVIVVGLLASFLPAIVRRAGRGSGTLARREGENGAGLLGGLVNFGYFAFGVLVSLFAPEIRAFFGL